jgi:NADH-quinone oxidoreductase subunit N
MMTMQDVYAIGPAMIVFIVTMAVLMIDAISSKLDKLNCWLTIGGLAVAMGVAATTLGTPGKAFAGMVNTGGYASFFAMVFCVAGMLSAMLSQSYVRREMLDPGEYYALLQLAVIGMMFMAAAADVIVFFLGLELMSVSFYALAGFARKKRISNEAAMKYFLLGAFATGFLLYGIALLYGSAGTTNIHTIVQRSAGLAGSPMFLIGWALLLIGLVFKIAAVPFHMWVPDVYEGSPTPVSGFMSTGGKAAAFSAFLMIFTPALLENLPSLREVMAVIAALSIIAGNVIAISQSNIKRMLAYSSIAHAGYILVGLVAGNEAGSNGVLFYLIAYTMMNVGAFGVLASMETSDGKNLTFDDYAGFAERKPLLAMLMAVFMFSLTGIPPFAGFFGKYYVFAGAVEAGYTWLAIVGVLMSVVSAYYYLRLVVLMYFKDQAGGVEMSVSRLGLAGLLISAIALIFFGIFPSTVVNITSSFF